jgi:hypothetical protein
MSGRCCCGIGPENNKLIFFYLYYHHVVFYPTIPDYSMKFSSSPVVPPVVVFETNVKPSEAFNRCGIRDYRLYLPAFVPKRERTVDNVIPHWTHGLKSFFTVPKNLTYEWFGELVREINEIHLENGANSGTHFVTRDGDSFIQNVLIPNVEQICQNVCIPRGNLDGSLIEMFMAGANMVTSEPVMKVWQALVKETIVKCKCSIQENQEEEEDPTCDCEMCEYYREDSYSQSTCTTDCSGDPICNSDTDSDWE